jgi:Domain of unknown function (DUF4263)
MEFQFRQASREDILKSDPLAELHVYWLQSIALDVVEAFRVCIDTAADEKPIQRFLTEHPIFLVLFLHGGHGRWVIPQTRLGAEFVPDLVVGDADSDGTHWTLVELESPRAKLFTKKGPPGRELNQALYQIRSWRSWIGANRDYAIRPPGENGLGLTDISANAAGLILIGRRATLTAEDVERRKELHSEQRVLIHTYDWLLDVAEATVVARNGESTEAT